MSLNSATGIEEVKRCLETALAEYRPPDRVTDFRWTFGPGLRPNAPDHHPELILAARANIDGRQFGFLYSVSERTCYLSDPGVLAWSLTDQVEAAFLGFVRDHQSII